jgi:short subunit dehydrogenase-like uncharacterized protein
MASKIGEGGALRVNGTITKTRLGKNGMLVDFGLKKLFVMSIPWGDISTAHFTTGIPNIETFTGIAKKTYYFLKAQFLFNWLLRKTFVRNIIHKKIKSLPAGPSDTQREKAIGFVWGQATNAAGETATVRITGPEGYTLTLLSSLLIVQKSLEGIVKAGYQTPSLVYGENFVFEIPGVKKL